MNLSKHDIWRIAYFVMLIVWSTAMATYIFFNVSGWTKLTGIVFVAILILYVWLLIKEVHTMTLVARKEEIDRHIEQWYQMTEYLKSLGLWDGQTRA